MFPPNPTIMQKRVAEELATGEHKSAKALLEHVGYAPSISKQPNRILESTGVKMALAELGMSEFNAAKVVNEIMHDKNAPSSARLTASDMTFKVHGTYAPVKQEVASVTIDLEALKELRGLAGGIGDSMRE